ncbi:MAG: hypothetical protein ABFD82_03800 [Syntrophaceae bacterium]
MKLTPYVVEIDMGYSKPLKYAVWFPYPVYMSQTGIAYNIHPKQRFTTRERAEKYLAEVENV